MDDLVAEARALSRLVDEMMYAAKMLSLSLTDEMLETLRLEWGNTNAAVLRHWRDEVIRVLSVKG